MLYSRCMAYPRVGDAGNRPIRTSKSFLEEGIRDRGPSPQINGQNHEHGAGGLAPEIGVGHGTLRRRSQLLRLLAIARNGRRYVRSVSFRIIQETGIDHPQGEQLPAHAPHSRRALRTARRRGDGHAG